MAITMSIDLASLNGSNGFRLDGVAVRDYSGESVSNAGDVNGDGFDDVIVGALGADPNGDYSGSSYVVFGKASGFDAAINLSGLDGSNGFRLDGAVAQDFSGGSVSNAGDVNGDGFDDVIVGARGADYSTGSSYVVFGKASGFDAAINLSGLDGSNGFRLDGENGLSGSSVSNAGDVNGDGFDDVIVGAPFAGFNKVFPPGSSYVVFGKASGFSATIDLSSLDGSNGFRLDGERKHDQSGASISGAGDVNGDGFDDLIVGVIGEYFGFNYSNDYYSRYSHVVFGKASGFSATMQLSSLDGSNGFRLDGLAELDQSGVSVSGAGDVNGDGLSDVIIGIQGENTSYVVFGKASGFSAIMELFSLDGSNGFRLDGVSGSLGSSVSNAGDVNGDGYDDLIVGAHDAYPNGSSSGSSYVVFGKASGFSAILDLSRLDGSKGFRLDGNATNDFSGASVSNAGDVNGDGFDDLIVGASGADPNGYSSGSSYIIFGRSDFGRVVGSPGAAVTYELANLDGSNGFRLDGEALDSSGSSVSTAGDINGDGFDDVIVGAWGADPNGELSGSSYVVFGKASGFNAAMNLSDLDGNNGFRLDGVSAYARLGLSVSNAGDVNGDGFDDVIVGAYGADPNNGELSGSSYVVFGKASGFNATMNLSVLDGSNGFRLDGEAAGDMSGISVSNAGDVNGDGFDDVIVGAAGADPNGNSSGSSYVVFGKASGFSATLEFSSLDGSNGFRLDGVAWLDHSGFSVSSAGDVNGDGFDDLIVGADGADPNGYDSGSSYVVFGKASGFSATLELSSLDGSNGFRLDGVTTLDYSGRSVSSAGDVNGDGFDDVIVGVPDADPNGSFSGSSYVVFGKASGFSATLELSSLDGSNGFRLDGVTVGDRSGSSVSNAGDVNGDGFDDLIVSAPSSGSSYVVFGKASGFSATLELSHLIGSNGFRLDGVTAGDFSGSSVSSAGDVNGDGFDDLIVGASRADPNGEFSGSSYIIFGRSDLGRDVDFPGTAGDDELTGTKAAERFEAGAGNDRMIGRGGADVFYGEAGDDYIRVADLNFQWADGGAGRDTLGLGGSGQNLDLSSAQGRISNIETIYLYGTGDNTLTLTALDVVYLSSTSNTLRVNGNEGDRIVGLGRGWDDGGVHGKFHTYTQGEAVLLVGVNVATDFV